MGGQGHGQNQSSWYLGQGSIFFSSETQKRPLCSVSQGRLHKLYSMVVVPVGFTRNAVVSLALWSMIPASGVNGVLDRPDQLMAWQWQRSQSVRRSLRWCHPPGTSWTTYPQVVVMNSPPAHFQSPPEEEFKPRAPGLTCFSNRNLDPSFICAASPATQRSAGCAASPPHIKSVYKISRKGWSLTFWQRYSAPADSDGTTM